MKEIGEEGGDQGGWRRSGGGGGGQGRTKEDGEIGGGQGRMRRTEEDGEAEGGQDRGMGSREGQSVIPGQHLAHFLLQGCFCSLLPEEAGHSAHSVLGEHLRGSLEQDVTLLPLKPALSCSRGRPFTDREPPPLPNRDPGHSCPCWGSTPVVPWCLLCQGPPFLSWFMLVPEASRPWFSTRILSVRNSL